MQSIIENIRKTRQWLLESIADLTPDQLNEIPQGFNNNIIWNLAHLVSAQQGLCYVRAGLPTVIDEQTFNDFKSGTRPNGALEKEEIEKIKALMFSTLEQLQKDYDNKKFKDYTTFKTRYGVEMKTVEDAIEFLPYHEGMHTGVITSLKKLVQH
ncbi:MAG: DinB family protein [Ferruginibacter sp.]